jgi:hypothetical protein
METSCRASVESTSTAAVESTSTAAVESTSTAAVKSSAATMTTVLGKGSLWREAKRDACDDCAKNI